MKTKKTQISKSSKSDMITVEHLVKQYHKTTTRAIDDVSFSVGQGEFFALLGPNGAGKTTTISVLTTTLAKTSGKVLVGGYDVDREAAAVRERIGVIFQSPSLDQNLSAEENIRLHVSLYGVYPYYPFFSMMPAAYKQQVKDIAEILDIAGSLHQPVKTLSGGMKRKLEIVRSLIHLPSVLFLDEPTTGLDPISRRSLWSYLNTVRQKQGVTIFLTTHYLEEAEGSDRVCIMNKGQIVAIDTPAKLKQKYHQKSLEDVYLTALKSDFLAQE